MPYCLYVRKSRADIEAETRGEGETLTRHINTLLELAKRRHLNVTQIHREIVSGETIAARPIMQQLLSEVEEGMWEGVLVMEVERLARGDTIDQGLVAQAFKFSNTKIITPIKDYDPNNEFDEEYFEFGLFMSRREYKTINRRLQRGRLASVKEGKYVGSKSPYGYERVKLEKDKGFTLKPIPEEADVVKMIYQLYTTGELNEDGTYERIGVSRIARRLNSLKISPRVNDTWSTASLRDILTNPIYIGKIRWNWRKTVKTINNGQVSKSRPRSTADNYFLCDGLHPAIIDESVFNKAQELMNSNPPRPIGVMKSCKNPLSGLVICSKCGRRMVRRPYSNGYPDIIMCDTIGCDQVGSFLSVVEKRVLKSLENWLTAYEIEYGLNDTNQNEYRMQIEVNKKALERLKSEYQKLNSQLDSCHDLLEQGVYSIEQFLERSQKLASRIKENEDKRAELEKQIATDNRRIGSYVELIPKIKYLLEVYDSLNSPKEKNDLLKEVLEKVVYTKDKGGRWHSSPDDFEVVIYPKLQEK